MPKWDKINRNSSCRCGKQKWLQKNHNTDITLTNIVSQAGYGIKLHKKYRNTKQTFWPKSLLLTKRILKIL